MSLEQITIIGCEHCESDAAHKYAQFIKVLQVMERQKCYAKGAFFGSIIMFLILLIITWATK